MKNNFKKFIAAVLSAVIIIGILPFIDFTPKTSAATLTLAQLQTKFPAGKYWNGGNADKYTTSPCSCHNKGICTNNISPCTCNHFDGGTQCFGYALKLAYDAYGTYASKWTRAYSLSNVKAGDIINYNGTGHTVFVTAVSGNTVYFTDCNTDGHCKIRWGASRQKSEFNNLLNIYVAPYDLGNKVTHTKDTNYGTNFIAYPKAKITSSNVLDENHNSKGSSAWIGTADKCTINEVYTDGCCKVTYPLDSGGTTTAYVKYSLFRLPKLSVYYNANGGKITSDTYSLTSNVVYKSSEKYAQTWTYNDTKENGLVDASTFGLSKTGYKFAGWGTSTSGGTVFSQSDSTLKPSQMNSSLKNGDCSVTLYAQWTDNILTVNYYSNYATTSFEGALNTVASNKNVIVRTVVNQYSYKYSNGLYDYVSPTSGTYLARTGYTANGNWNTKVDGTGYSVNQSTGFETGQALAKALGKDISSGNASVNLYPEWVANTYTINYNANGGTGTTASTSHTYDTEKTLAANGYEKAGYNFVGWNTKADGSGAKYADKAKVKNLTATNKGSVTLYAQWSADTYTVNYNANGGEGSMSSSTFTYGTIEILDENSFTNQGYSFTNWNTEANGNGENYTNGQSVINIADYETDEVTLYAQWTPNNYKVTFNANGGSCSVLEKNVIFGETYGEMPVPVMDGYNFDGWYTSLTGGTKVTSTSNITVASNHTLYAHWGSHTHSYSVKVIDPTCTSQGYSIYKCDICEDTYTANYVNKISHVKGNWITVIEATCETKGEAIQRCVNCGTELGEKLIPATGHDYRELNRVATTCTTDGVKTYRCTHCDKEYTAIYEEAYGHTYGSWIVSENSTCSKPGTETCECELCGEKKNREIPALPHDYNLIIIAPSCTEQGYTIFRCNDCGYSYLGDYIDATGHDYESETTAPTCQKGGYTTYTCSFCNEKYVGNRTEAIGHEVGAWIVDKAATTKAEGLMHRECTLCKTRLEESIIPKIESEEDIVSRTVIGIEILTLPTKTVYTYKKDNFNPEGLTLNVKYSDGFTDIVYDTSKIYFTGFNNRSAGVQNITAIYEGKAATFPVTVSYTWWQTVIRIFLFGFIWY